MFWPLMYKLQLQYKSPIFPNFTLNGKNIAFSFILINSTTEKMQIILEPFNKFKLFYFQISYNFSHHIKVIGTRGLAITASHITSFFLFLSLIHISWKTGPCILSSIYYISTENKIAKNRTLCVC